MRKLRCRVGCKFLPNFFWKVAVNSETTLTVKGKQFSFREIRSHNLMKKSIKIDKTKVDRDVVVQLHAFLCKSFST
jgi:hypothetical protein